MGRLRYNGLSTTLGGSLTSAATSVTFAGPLTHSGGISVPTITGSDYIPLTILDASGKASEIVYLTTYTSGATSGGVSRAQEGTTGASHASGDEVVHGLTVQDVGQPKWIDLPLNSGWASNANRWGVVPRYRVLGDVVQIVGTVRNTSTTSFGTATAFATLPTGARPLGLTYFSARSGNAGVNCAGTVNADGTIDMVMNTSDTWFDVQFIQFPITST